MMTVPGGTVGVVGAGGVGPGGGTVGGVPGGVEPDRAGGDGGDPDPPPGAGSCSTAAISCTLGGVSTTGPATVGGAAGPAGGDAAG